jgi:hypothetical protein
MSNQLQQFSIHFREHCSCKTKPHRSIDIKAMHGFPFCVTHSVSQPCFLSISSYSQEESTNRLDFSCRPTFTQTIARIILSTDSLHNFNFHSDATYRHVGEFCGLQKLRSKPLFLCQRSSISKANFPLLL